MTGEIMDATQQPLVGLRAEVWLIPNKVFSHGNRFVVDHPVKASLTGTSWSANLEPTGVGEGYLLQVRYLDPNGVMRFVRERTELFSVPEGGGTVGGEDYVLITPETVTTSLVQPTNNSPYWLEAAIGEPDSDTSTGPGNLYVLEG